MKGSFASYNRVMDMSETRSAPVKPIDAEPVAWLHVDGVSVISNKVKDLWIKVRSAQFENYTTPLFKANREPFAWSTFDGEGGYDLRLYECNESYKDEFEKSNGAAYKGWVEPLYRHTNCDQFVVKIPDYHYVLGCPCVWVDEIKAAITAAGGRCV